MAEDKKKTAAPSAAAATKSTKSTKTVDRTFVSASTGEQVEKTMGRAAGTGANVDLEASHAVRAALAKGKRTGAIILWALGIVCEALCILGFTQKLYDWFNGGAFGEFTTTTTWLIIMLAVDAVLVIIGSLLWKSANHIDPPKKEGNAFKYWAQTELGTIIAVIAFLPIIIFLLTNKDIDGNMKKVGVIGAAAALVLCGLCGVDYNPQTEEAYDAMEIAEAELADAGVCYWTPYGQKYHFNPDCQYLKRSTTIYQGTVQEAFDAGRTSPCSGCAIEGGQYVLHEVAGDDAVQQDAA